VAMTAGLVLVAVPAAAQYPQAADIVLSDASIDCPSGEVLTITGSGFDPNGPAVQIFFDGQQVAEVSPDNQGNISVTIDPPSSAAGEHTITATQPAEPEPITASATVTCVAAAGVAFTGYDITLGLILLVILVLAGAAALLLGRRRARAAG
jgi:IPT/TIG domain